MESADSQPSWTAQPEAPRVPPSATLVGRVPWADGELPTVEPTGRVTQELPAAAAAEPRPIGERVDAWMRKSPPLTASLSLHVLLLLLLALVVVREQKPRRLSLEMSFAGDHAGEEAGPAVTIAAVEEEDDPLSEEPRTEAETIAAEAPPAESSPDPAEPPPEPSPEDPSETARTDQVAIVTPPAVEPRESPRDAQSDSPSRSPPDVRQALSGRSGAAKAALVARGGGGETEAAVARALAWLAKKQGSDGLWSLQGPYPDGSNQENRLAATAMALMAFQGAGHTPRDGDYRTVMDRGWKTLLKSQAESGVFELGRMPDQHAMYAHAQATIAVCELYAMTRDEAVRPAAERAIAYCLAAQMPDGGWRYRPPQAGYDNKGDMSVTGWFMMALKTAEMGGLPVPVQTYDRVTQFLDGVFISDTKGYGYQIIPNQKVVQVRPALTAEALLCRQYLGCRGDDPRLLAGVGLLIDELPFEFRYPHKNVYAWYYATQVLHHLGGEPWDRWNAGMRKELTAAQIDGGKEAGSWDPTHDQWGHFGGRLFMTCLCTYMLEVYYRHAPLALSP